MDTQQAEREPVEQGVEFDVGDGRGERSDDLGGAEPSTEQLSQTLREIEGAIERIAGQVSQLQRGEQSSDFNLSHLLGAVVQVVALAFMAWALLAVLKSEPQLTTAMLSLLGAIATQLLAMTLFSSSRRQ